MRCKIWHSIDGCVAPPYIAMGVKISREMPFSVGSRGFRFRNHEDVVADQKQYEEGCTLEQARFRRGSLAQQIYQRLSSDGILGAYSKKLISKK